MSTQPSLRPVLLPTAVAAIGGFLFGFDSGVINGTVGALTAAFGSNAAVTGFTALDSEVSARLRRAASGLKDLRDN